MNLRWSWHPPIRDLFAQIDPARIASLGVTPVVKDLAEISDMKRDLWQKQDSIRHDPAAVAETLMGLLQARG